MSAERKNTSRKFLDSAAQPILTEGNTMAAAIIPMLLPLVEPLGAAVVNTLRDSLKSLVDNFHHEYPDQTFWEVLQFSIEVGGRQPHRAEDP